MWKDWIFTNWTSSALVLLSVLCIYSVIILYTRIVGLRSFSKMSASDFAMTVAVGSILGSSILSSSPPILLAVAALGGLFGMQWLIAFSRAHSSFIPNLIDNEPLLLMSGPEILEENMLKARVTVNDLHSKLREANVWNYQQVIAVIFEATGDISVIHKSGPDNLSIDSEIFENVRDNKKLT